MRLLAVPNWSFGRNKELLHGFRDTLDALPVAVHYCAGDVDHNRTITACSGAAEALFEAIDALADLAFESIDLGRHVGVHPRIGALDVCPVVVLDGNPDSLESALALAEDLGEHLAQKWDLPVYFYEKSEHGVHANDLPSLRRGGFGAMLGRELRSDVGPKRAHPQLGVSVVGVRDFLIAFNVPLTPHDGTLAKEIAREIRTLRQEGDERFLGVRALGFPLASRGMSQVSLNVTLPDIAPIDPIVDWIKGRARSDGADMGQPELVGVIRARDLDGATHLRIDAAQIVETRP